ncbi:hypothetical protein ABOM_009018 [Aspergillus bombycis]|uniref:Protein kinase domain-containing protein n=1 Tax=Aspergillus bombycis TaxID=109264 RepID=A0A1F7ZTJ7_9EURO|nr:hypothetical protein ABOM_009018 [Aspergillus bombycis]OGM42781.1 hypothetical protein ABOM_009018 [Aspergillus bombycis]
MAFSYNVDTVGSFPQEQILGIGRTGLVVRRQQTAIKLPLRWSTSSDDEVEANIEFLQHEQSIYRRLGKCDHVVPALSFSDIATALLLMENGNGALRHGSDRWPSYCHTTTLAVTVIGIAVYAWSRRHNQVTGFNSDTPSKLWILGQ